MPPFVSALILLGIILFIAHMLDKKMARDKAIRKKKGNLPARFRNPANGYEEEATSSWLWCLLFGPAYFALKGVWTHMVFAAALALVTAGISWVIYPFFAKDIIARNYLRRGWVPIVEEAFE